MSHPRTLALALFVALLVGCDSIAGRSEPVLATNVASERSPSPAQGAVSMDRRMRAGPVPSELNVRLQRRDTTPLPSGALVKFQQISRGLDPRYNYRWVLYDDGRWFLARHSNDESDWQTPFDTELPTSPTKRLSANVVDQVKAELRKASFLTEQPYQEDPTVEDGSYFIVTARLDGNEHEVIYNAVYSPLVKFLRTIESNDQ